MNKIRIKKVKELKYEGVSLKLRNTFFVNKNESSFYIDVQREDFTFCMDKPEKIDKIVCYTMNDKPITLINCSIVPTNSKKVRFHIVYNLMIIGEIIESIDNILINNLHIDVINKKLNYNMWIGKNEYIIDKGKICVQTDWNTKKVGLTEKVKGVSFKLKTKGITEYTYLINSFFKLLIIYYFFIGYFPEKYNIYFYKNGRKITIINPIKTIYRSMKSSVDINKVLYLTDKDLSKSYDIFSELYDNNLILFHLFFSINYNSDNFEEIRTFNYIQCFESFFNNILMIKDNCNNIDNVEKIIITHLKEQLENENSKIRTDITKSFTNQEKVSIDDIIKKVSARLNNIERVSLYRLIKIILETEESRIIFKYEYDNNYISIIRKKLYHHRNLFAHINKDRMYLVGLQNDIIQEKLDLLFRILVLNNINVKISKKRFEDCIESINSKYYDMKSNNYVKWKI